MRILIVEDEIKLASALVQLLKNHRYIVDSAADGETGLDLILTDAYDVVVLDVMLPKMSGFDVLKRVREHGLGVPILLLTARDTVQDRVHGLDCGADDYLVKPFATEELLARIRALTRRSGPIHAPETIQVGRFSLDTTRHVVLRDGEPLSLTSKEFQLLELMMRNAGQVLSKELILDRVWGPDAAVIGNAVENYVHFIRRKIDVPGEESYIQTVRGVGYVFRKPSHA
jgi:DNA-binding response OmpR family regulator